jgi:putative membrane protein
MGYIAALLVAIVALEHVGIMVLEMFYWTSPYALKSFNMTEAAAVTTKTLAANQGLYNGFLAAGLIWGLISKAHGYAFKVFFLLCVIVAGTYGGATAKPSILFVQALPAAVALAAVWFAERK